jgi:shikimate kinase
MMGAGKTTVGKKLAKALGYPFVDLDRIIEKANGVSIATIFEIEGEAGFRLRESQALGQVAAGSSQVVATGGGVVLSPLNRSRLVQSGFVVYLHASPELLYERTRHDKARPLLRVSDPLVRIRTLVLQRDPLYREVSDMIAESGAGLNNTVAAIEKVLKARCPY